MSSIHLNRREILSLSVAAVASHVLSRPSRAQPATTTTTSAAKVAHRYKVAASDWMMLKRQTPGALTRAKECDLDGVEVDMGPLGNRPDFENKLRDDDFRTKYLAQAKELDLAISSLAMSAFYGQPVADHPKAEQFCNDWIALMPQIGTKVGFLPVIFKKEDEQATAVAKVVALMRKVAPTAQSAGVIIGLNTPLDAAGNVRLLDDIGSPAVRIAYNCGEAIDAKRDVYAELQALGKDRIAQIIPTLSDGVWLQNDARLDVPKLKQLLDEMGWSGWLVLQRSRDAAKARDVKYNFGANGKYVKSIFQA
ncbi:MAG: TIM barrel protein [Tepidisphaeraceae bacterium]